MSEPDDPHASKPDSNRASSPSPSSKVDMTQHHQPLLRTRGRAPSEPDEYALPAMAVAGLVGAGSSSHGYNGKQATSERESPARVGAAIHPKAAAMLVDMNSINPENFHYPQSLKRPTSRHSIPLGTSFDIESDEDDDEDDLSGRNGRGRLQQKQSTVQESTNVFGSDHLQDLYDDSSIKYRSSYDGHEDSGLDANLIVERHHRRSHVMRRLLKHGIGGTSTEASNRFTETTGPSGGVSTAGSMSYEFYHHHHQSTSSLSMKSSRTYGFKQKKHRQERGEEHPRSASSAGFFIHKLLNSPAPASQRSSLLAHRSNTTNKSRARTPQPTATSAHSARSAQTAPIATVRSASSNSARPRSNRHPSFNSAIFDPTTTTTAITEPRPANPEIPPEAAAAATIIVTSPSSSNVIIQEASSHPSPASWFDFLNLKSTVSHITSASASALAGSASGSGSAVGPDAGPVSHRFHSRNDSHSTVGNSLRNLNRWSSSTLSSRLSASDYHFYPQQEAQHSKRNSFSRRMSLDSIRLWSQQSDSVQDSHSTHRFLPRKLSKRRAAQNRSPSPDTRTTASSGFETETVVTNSRDHPPPPLPPSTPPPPPPPPPAASPPDQPPTISLPLLNTDFDSSFLDLSRAMSRASPVLNPPNSVFATQRGNGEPQDHLWSDLYDPTRTASPVTRANPTLLPPAPVTRDRDVSSENVGNSKGRSAAHGKGNSSKTKERSTKPSQKAMLSKALNKANAAVQLDNAKDYIEAKVAYKEACELLQQVLTRTSGEDDRKKLDAIRLTYTVRIQELDELGSVNPHEDKALPARPGSVEYHGVSIEVQGIDNHADDATIMGLEDELPNSLPASSVLRPLPEVTIYSDFSRDADLNNSARQTFISRSMRNNGDEPSLTIPRSDDVLLPAPLSPCRPLSPARSISPQLVVRQDFSLASERGRLTVAPDYRSHRRNLSHESSSWLDPIDESGDSETSSVHSRSSSRIVRKHIRLPSGDTEAEFDAALDAAVEAAYDDGYDEDDADEDRAATSMRKVDMTQERLLQTEREALIEAAREHERQRQKSQSQLSHRYIGDFLDANDSEDEEEERMLEEITRGYVMEDFAVEHQPGNQSSIPRESDSSGFTSRTWHSSSSSNPPAGTTAFSAVRDSTSSGSLSKTSSPPPMPPPTQSLPQLPNQASSKSGVRNRRLSGSNAKQLKIETSALGSQPTLPLPSISASSATQAQSASQNDQEKPAPLAIPSLPGPVSMRVSSASPVRSINPPDGHDSASPPSGQDDEVHTGSPTSLRPTMRKIFSSSSLKSLKSRQLSVSHAEDIDPSPLTPLTMQVSNASVTRLPMMPAIPTPTGMYTDRLVGGFSGLHLFESDFHSPGVELPHSNQQQKLDVPLPLEPCPADPMLRPFWLMRALYQTLAHPRGGYISNRLFVPQDAWKVKGVKLRNLEDKISQCDLLTAALLKLARVDSTDADAVLDEMQSFENILESIQTTLSRKLGTDVGTQGMMMFKEEKESEVPLVPRNNSMSSKAGTFSWRRLRNKGSAVNLTGVHGIKSGSSGGGTGSVSGIPEKEPVVPSSSMPSLPMVAHPSSKPARRDVASVKFDGPNANYRACLARLFDAAQTVDQIARQVEDPGLRHVDKTQVGLELCTRHAAEFFGFFICRFVLTDLGLLLDKFVKRGSEWVLN